MELEKYVLHLLTRGLQNGFDIKNIKKISKNVKIPVLAHGGCGNSDHVLDLAESTNVSGVVIASYFHYSAVASLKKLKLKLVIRVISII